MKIIFDNQIFRSQKYGGISRYFYEISNRLANLGNEVEIISPLYKCSYFKKNDLVKPTGLYDNANLLKYRLANNLNNLTTSLLIRTRKNVDIYHETFFDKNDYCPNSAARIITVYDMIHEALPHFFSSTDTTSYYKKAALERADHIICISESTKTDLVKHLNIPDTKTSVVHLGSSIKKSTGGISPLGDVPYLLFVGHRGLYKNFKGFLEAYANCRTKKDFGLVCFGGGLFSKEEKALLRKSNIPDDRIRQISGDDILLSNLYSSAAAFVFPSMYEGFGLPLVEAMTANCPVISSNTSSLPEVAGPAAEYFDPSSRDSLIAALENVVYDEGRRKALIKAGSERCKEFSWEKCAVETEKVYKKVSGI